MNRYQDIRKDACIIAIGWAEDAIPNSQKDGVVVLHRSIKRLKVDYDWEAFKEIPVNVKKI
jgi:hypothetical protein